MTEPPEIAVCKLGGIELGYHGIGSLTLLR